MPGGVVGGVVKDVKFDGQPMAPDTSRYEIRAHPSGRTVFNQADPDDTFTTLSLHEDPEPA